jgi:hypothetical protein
VCLVKWLQKSAAEAQFRSTAFALNHLLRRWDRFSSIWSGRIRKDLLLRSDVQACCVLVTGVFWCYESMAKFNPVLLRLKMNADTFEHIVGVALLATILWSGSILAQDQSSIPPGSMAAHGKG